MKKKLLSLLLVFGMLNACFAGCGNQKSGDDGDKAPSNKSDEQKNEESTYPDYLNLESARPIVKDGEDITLSVFTLRETGATSDINDQWFVRFLEEKMNIKMDIEEVDYVTGADKLNLMFSSGELPDILFYTNFSNSDVVRYGDEEEMLLPISDYFSEELTPNILQTLSDYPDIKKLYTTPSGKMYTLPVISMTDPLASYGHTYLMYSNKYLEALGVEELPTTLEEFKDFLRACNELDPAVMGVDEIYPLMICDGLDNYTLPFSFGWVGTSVVKPAWDVNKEEVVIPCMEENFADYIEFYNTLYTEGLIHKDYYTIDSTTKRALIAEGKCAVIFDWIPSLFESTGEDLTVGIPLTSEYCDTPMDIEQASFSNGLTFISADTEYPELCVRLLDYLYSKEGSLYEYWGPAAGSEDTMGLVEGFSADENGTIGVDVEYIYNQIEIAQCAPININHVMNYAYESLGLERKVLGRDEDAVPSGWQEAWNLRKYRMHEDEDVIVQKSLPELYLTRAEIDEITDLYTPIAEHVNAEMAKFVTGVRSLDELDKFFEELKELGVEEYHQIYLDEYKDYVRE